MTIPLIAFFYLYLLFVLAWLVFTIIALYHIIRFGQISFMSFTVTLAYLVFSAVILSFSYAFLSQMDWTVGLTVFQGGVNFFGSNNF
jgi:hypothetical protein